MNKAKSVTKTTGTTTIHIGGKSISIYAARLTYRCRECLGGLKFHNSGLACVANSTHRGFVHRTEAKQIQERQAQNITELEQFYVIKDGKVEIKCQS